MKLAMLQPRVQMMRTNAVKSVAATERLSGGTWMRTIARIMRRDNGVCQCAECRAAMAPRPAHQVDHIVELVDGGSNADSNLQALHTDCHARKTAASAKSRQSGR